RPEARPRPELHREERHEHARAAPRSRGEPGPARGFPHDRSPAHLPPLQLPAALLPAPRRDRGGRKRRPGVTRETRLRLLLSLLVLALNVLSVSAHLGLVHKPKQVKERDHYRYIEMAKGPEGRQDLATESTYCWRILVPGLARGLHALGVDLNLAFY